MATPLQPLQHRRYGRLPSPGSTPATSAARSAFFSFAARGVRLGSAVSSFRGDVGVLLLTQLRRRRRECESGGGGGGGGGVGVVVSCSSAAAGSGGGSWWEDWRAPPAAAAVPRLSDVVWPSAGAFMAAVLGKMDQIMAPTGLSLTIAPLGAVCAVLFATPSTPGARKYNMFLAQIGCAAFGVLALSVFGPGWLARSTALAASVAFMITTRAIHPPAASLPILFIDGTKFHNLHFWYALFPGATGCILLCLIQELVEYLKENYKF